MGANLFSNADFESGIANFDNWIISELGTSSVNVETSNVFSGSQCCRFDVDSSNSYVRVAQTVAVVGEEYTLSFWARGSEACSLATESWIPVETFNITTEWQKYSITAVATGTVMTLKRNSAPSQSIYIDKMRFEATPVKYAVITQTLSSDIASPYTDAIQTGFGNIKAAIVLSSYAYSTTPISVQAASCVGLWDGTNQIAISTMDTNGAITTTPTRVFTNDKILTYFVNTTKYADYVISSITDGVRFELTYDATGVSKYVTVILIGGADVEAYVNAVRVADGTSVSGAGFQPNFVLTCGACCDLSSTITTYYTFAIGAAIQRPSKVQRTAYLYGHPGVDRSDNGGFLDNNVFMGQYINSYASLNSWYGQLGQFTSDGCTYSVTNNPLGDSVGFMLLKTPGINIDIHDITIPETAGSQSITGIGFKPGLVLSFMGYNTTVNTQVDHVAFSMGASDGVTEGSYAVMSVDNVDTTSSYSAYNASLINAPTPSGSAYSAATISSFDADGYTLNWGGVTGSGQVGFAIAFQAANDSKKLIGTSSGKIYFKQ